MKEQLIEMRDGERLYSTSHEPTGAPVAIVHIVHGLAEHSGRYRQFTDYLVSEGYIVTAHDQRGHGKTAVENNRPYGYIGEAATFDQLVDDTFEVIQCYKQKYPHLKVTLFGHSMGSFVARRFIQLYGDTLCQVVLSGTGSQSKTVGLAGLAFAKWRERNLANTQPDELLHKIVFGEFSKRFPDEGSSAWLSRYSESVREYDEDEACGFVPTSQLFRILLEGVEAIESTAFLRNIPSHLPILLVSGTEDPVGERAKGVWKTAKQFMKAGQQHVQVVLYEGGRHEMLQETNRQEVSKNIVGWMKKNECIN
ncbi:alpha/beta fold hydrolase [Sporosarcina sp. PTS2304]|uniref:alpha/beta hydrolase n=1 Tax=Sporosarcina sp. PTS2304 TaxID=2283194 RepID=UPI000E0D6563|nr:alpha/beta hydrolase [Sporosarcina sp. PTS2304]AXH98776.1 alpha/beta fold hydrolase [Sporosarcina sp. PTS2304]